MPRSSQTNQCRVIAHRGASAYLPEHTLAAYALAIRQGADFIEPDLVMSADGVLLARHDGDLRVSTDFDRHPQLVAHDPQARIERFELSQLAALRAVEPDPTDRGHGRRYDGLFAVPTLQQIIDLLRRLERETGRSIGLCPELKTPARFAAQGLDMVGTLLDQLEANGYQDSDAPVWLQCFDAAVLQDMAERTELPLMQLLEPRQGAGQPDGVDLEAIGRYARAIGPRKDMVLDGRGHLVREAQVAGLQVYPWVVDGDNAGELSDILASGVDGFFCNEPDKAVAAVRRAALSLRS